MRGLVTTIALAGLSFGCGLAPSARERSYADDLLRSHPSVVDASVGCLTGFVAASALCADAFMADGTVLRFAGVGYRSFGPTAARVLVAEAGGLVPRVISCGHEGVRSTADFHRTGLFGHHFSPRLTDVSDALRRHREVVEELEFWPRCPQFWEVQDGHGVNHRYCAQRVAVPLEPPPPLDCR